MSIKEFRWGILGPGRIAKKFAASLPFSANGKLWAVAGSDEQRNNAFASEFGAKYTFKCDEDLLESGLVDAVYIARPHSFHRRDAEKCLIRKIPVLCEKPLTTNPEDSRALVRMAADHNTFLLEGLWTVFLPSFQKAIEWVKAGLIGEILHAEAGFGHAAARDFSQRHFNPELGGGVMKDIGIYPLALFMKLFGHGAEIQSNGIRMENGVDAQVAFQGLSQDKKSSFQGLVSFLGSMESAASITGSKGRIVFEAQWFRAVDVRLEIPGSAPEVFSGQANGFGFQYQADEVERCVRAGWLQSSHWTHADSLEAARLISLAEKF